MTDDPKTAWYCTCDTGAIMVVCCAHVASIIWYLSHAHHNNFQKSQTGYRIFQTTLERTIDAEESENSVIESIEY